MRLEESMSYTHVVAVLCLLVTKGAISLTQNINTFAQTFLSFHSPFGITLFKCLEP